MMKRILATLLVLALVAPAMAVTLSGTDLGGGKLQISYNIPSGEVVRGVALKLSTTVGTATIDAAGDVTAIPAAFNTYIDYAFSNPTGYTVGAGNPLADPAAAGVLDLATAKSVFSLSLGALDQAGGQAGVTGAGVLCEIQYTVTGASATIHVEADTLRGGAVVGDAVTQPTAFDVVLVPVVAETVSVPTIPTVPGSKFFHTQALPVSTGGSVSSLGHAVQYQFDYGDGTFSAWGTGLKISKSYALAAGTSVTIKAKARCAADTAIESAWSAGLTFTIGSECQKYNLTKRINAATDNTLSISDLNLLIGYVNANRTNTAAFSVSSTSLAWDARYNFDATASITIGDFNALVGYVNAARTNSAAFSRSCPTNP